jgi:Lrp/AsnC family transcriptional regulator, leucine-responsive regulatory protein
MVASRLDEVDARLLDLLQRNGRTAQQELAHAVGLSSPAVGERVRKLEERGIIRRYTAVVEPRAVGRDVTAFIAVGINGSHHFPRSATACWTTRRCWSATPSPARARTC